MSLFTWLRRAFHADGADVWMQRDGHELHWDAARLPLPVAYDGRMSTSWVEALFGAVRRVNEEVGLALFMLPVPAGDDAFVQQFNDEALSGLWPPGGVYVRVVAWKRSDPDPRTEHQYDKRTGEVRAARVSVPYLANDPRLMEPAVLHEMGHVLCLDHQPYPSVMSARLESPAQALGAVELGALRGRYR